MTESTFAGFTPDALAFLRDLAANNDRSWFAEHRDRYETGVKAQMHGYLAALTGPLSDQIPELEVRPDRIFRIHRDVRFSKSKLPYKTHIAAQLPARGSFEKGHTPGAYLHIEPGELFLGVGLYEPSRDQLARLRTAISTDPAPFLDATASPEVTALFGGLHDERLTRAPRGFDPADPMIDALRLKRFFLARSLPESAALGPGLVKLTIETLTAARPLIGWLLDTLGDPNGEDDRG